MTNKNKWIIGISCLLAVTASVFLWMKMKDEVNQKPPKGAPQLDIENPGTQDEFLTSAGESEIG